ncbi:SDR family NAD(P)-dependent oxidoreductase [Antrihabitans cavernicola]|uniref:SDR family NAD(P)-dependent oxidoreductase n=1 Tax=Antrihabitans cavernicola TaxID=2495913 RepID=A0A5A7S566_9NOCA|nr:SDR family NAD(P)-dependent oxidoreductase [Spelaeibacter cavernicola]KAA0016504.1 SDR family NAD(P)-dependent oxidoreductase [Spelaeibacter cavernicola]
MALELDGTRILLTGASSGIGRALAIQLAAQGATLAVSARRVELLDSLADRITADGHLRPHVLVADLAKPGAAQYLGERALAAFGGSVDILINNAGTSLTGAQTKVSDTAAARSVFETNLWSPLALTAAVVPSMRAAGHGTIANVTSTVQAVPIPLLGYYAASKSALAKATQSLRLELADTPIRVLEVVPGSTETALRDIDDLPWKTSPPRTLPPIAPESMAAAIVKALERGDTRLVHPAYSRIPLELPVFGRLVARFAGSKVNTLDAIR